MQHFMRGHENADDPEEKKKLFLHDRHLKSPGTFYSRGQQITRGESSWGSR
ncbi:hypothetical protein GcM3_224045 [Golovinomyces cichoracearum]|uniref:Uncharacterized protein n=1 Tax=Golovinomyces cichoracearum TaxID=62708 RepID=A0A420GLN2_9PEZI|nr:hypothetical protein GcM3_224045 [Golovinomyces cichoracearum]